MNWNQYFYNQFPLAFRKFESIREIKDCEHHQIPKHLAYFVDELKDYDFQPEFFMSWFGLTLIDQILHKYFPNKFEIWKSTFHEHPIPMRGSGMGCIIWDNPIWLIERYVPLNSPDQVNKFNSFLNFLFSVTSTELLKIDLKIEDFLAAIMNDKRVVRRESKASEIFVKYILTYK